MRDLPEAGDFPKLFTGEISLAAPYQWKTPANDSQMFFGLSIEVGLVPYTGTLHPETVRLTGQMIYNNGSWVLSAGANDLYVSNLLDLFDNKSENEATAVIENLAISTLSLTYVYSKVGARGVGSAFSISGVIRVEDFELDPGFKYKMPGIKG